MVTAKSQVDAILVKMMKKNNKDPSVKDVRNGVLQLLQLFKRETFRAKLAEEAGNSSVVAIKRKAVSLLWKNVLFVAMYAIKSIWSKKPQPEEYEYFSSLLMIYSPSADSDESDVHPRLSLEIIGKVKDFAFSTFEHDSILEVAESKILQMLLSICSRSDFVGAFRRDDFEAIMDILEPRLDVTKAREENLSRDTVEAAAKLLEALIKTSAALGISMHDHISECMYWATQRCLDHVKTDHTTRTTAVTMFKMISTVMRSEPDQAIGPLGIYGGRMLSVARQLFSLVDDADREALIDYLIAHLIVCQVAGTFQGLPSGDLGDVGKGTLNKKRLEEIMQAIWTANDIKAMVKESVDPPKPHNRASSGWWPLRERRRKYLELCARWVACLQRLYLAEEGWNSRDNPVEEILGCIEWDDNPESQMSDYSAELSANLPLSVLVQSPFMKMLLSPLCSTVEHHPKFSGPFSPSSQRFSQDSSMSSANASTLNDRSSPIHPVLSFLDEQTVSTPVDSNVPFLQLICACAESFPFGECWSTLTSGSIATFEAEDSLRDDAFQVKVSSPDDVALVIGVVGKILENAGRPGGSSVVQVWALRCLQQLANASACVVSVSQKSPRKLTLAWQSIWHCLLRPTLNYISFTKTAPPFSCGELILGLLHKIVQFGCTDLAGKRSSFLCREIHSVWKLPTFSDYRKVLSPVAFDLIQSAISQFGIRDDPQSTIDSTMLNSLSSTVIRDLEAAGCGEGFRATNRTRLLCYTLGRLRDEVKRDDSIESGHRLVSSLVGCCESIVLGQNLSTALSESQENTRLLEMSWEDLRVTSLQEKRRDLFCLDASKYEMRQGVDWIQSWKVLDTVQESIFRSKKVVELCTSERGSVNKGFVSKRDIAKMQEFSVGCLLANSSDEAMVLSIAHESESASAKDSSQVCNKLVGNIRAIRCCLSLTLCGRYVNSMSSDLSRRVMTNVNDVIDVSIEALVSSSAVVGNGRLFRSVEALVFDLLHLVPSTAENEYLRGCLLRLKDLCRDLLDGFNRSFVKSTSKEHCSNTDNLDDDSDDDQGGVGELAVDVRGKRRSVIDSTPSKRQKTARTSVGIRSLTAASSVASIMIMLEPTTATCKFVYEELALYDAGGATFANRQERFFDQEGAELSLLMICSNLDILTKSRKPDESLLSLCLNIVTAVRGDGVHGGDKHFAAGFNEITLVLEMCPVEALSIEVEASLTSFLLMCETPKEKQWLKTRPLLYVQRLAGAVAAYENCGESFRDTFRRSFASEFVIEAINAEGTQVRLKSAHALGVALRYLGKQRLIYEKVCETLALGRTPTQVVPILRTLHDAQKEREDSSCWKNLSMSIAYCIFRLWGVMAGCTTDVSIFQEGLFDCIDYAGSNPSSEPLCQIAIRRMSTLRGYESTEGLIRDETEYILGRWMTAKKPPGAVPINFSSSALMSNIIESGISCASVWGILKLQVPKIENIREEAAAEAVFASIPTALPLCLSRFTPSDLENLKTSNENAVPTDQITYLKVLNDNSHDDEQAPRSLMDFLASRVSTILSYGILEAARVETASCSASEVIKFSIFLASSIKDARSRKELLLATVRDFLKILGRDQCKGLHPTYCATCLLEVDELMSEDWPKLTEVIRGGAVELLVVCMYWLDRAQDDGHKISHWNAMEMMIRLIWEDGESTDFLKHFALRSTLGLLRRKQFLCCHLKVLNFVKESLSSTINRLVFSKEHDEILAFQFVGTLLQVHETCQKLLLNSLGHHFGCIPIHKPHSFGILAEDANTPSAIGFEWKTAKAETSTWLQIEPTKCLEVLSPVDKELAIATYETLKDVLRGWTHSGTPTGLASFMRKSGSHEVLATLNKKFVAQELIKTYVDSSNSDSTRCQLSAAASRFVFFKEHVRLLDGSRKESTHPTESLSLDARLLLDQTSCLSHALMSCDVTNSEYPTLDFYHLTRLLHDVVASESNPLLLRAEASKCLGYIGPAFVGNLCDIDGVVDSRMDWLQTVGADNHSLMAFTISQALVLLLEHLKSEKPIDALACLEACREIASTQEGTDAVKSMPDSDERDFMQSIIDSTVTRKKRPSLLTPSTKFVDSAIRIANSGQDPGHESNDWCWAPGLWEVGDSTFDVWIKRLVSSIIICCYGSKRTAKETGGTNSSFRAFARIAAISSSFAAFLLPRILLDVLLRDESPLGETRDNYSTVAQSWVGHPDSLVTKRVSIAFSNLSRSLEKRSDCECKSKASTIMSETIDLNRRISQKRFLEYRRFPGSRHKPAGESSKPRRFGCTLKLPVEVIVQTFMTSSKIASGVYYAETALSEMGLNGKSSERNEIAKADSKSLREANFSLVDVLQSCMRDLEEPEAASAYALKTASTNFFSSDFRLGDLILSQSTPAEKLQLLSVERLATGKNSLEIAHCLRDLGSIPTLRSYMNDIFRQQNLSEEEGNALKETWFQAKITAMKWNDTPISSRLEPQLEGSELGFFESVSGALVSLKHGDRSILKEQLASGRSQALLQCSGSEGRETMMTRMLPMIEQFQILNDLDSLGMDCSCVESMLSRWEKEASDQATSPTSRFMQSEFKLAVRESIIGFAKNTGVELPDADMERYLVNHQWLSASIGREQGRIDFAERCLQRSETILLSSQGLSRLVQMKIRLEEAKLMESRGYFKPAIQTTKLIMNMIEDQPPQEKSDKQFNWTELRADSLITCGIWTRKHRVESAKFVHENYLMPAAAACRELWYERRDSIAATRRLAASCLALAQNAATLFENVNAKITSKEWKAKKLFLEDQRVEYGQLDLASKGKGKEAKDDIRHRIRLKNAINRLEEELQSEEDDLGPFATLALEAFGEALAMCDGSSRENWTRHVFQMVSIWFSSHQRVLTMNEDVAKIIEKIPSFRFVPLARQLFSRMSSKQGEEWDPFQVTLQKLVCVMSRDHPYHCLPQILALSNGAVGNSGEDGHDPKVRAANTVLTSLREVADDNHLQLYHAYEAFTEAYHLLAMAKPSKAQIANKTRIEISDFVTNKDKQFDKILRTFSCVPCILTKPPTLLENHEYGNLMEDPPGTELIKGFNATCDIAETGVNLPKIIKCRGSTGKTFKQLVKGEDDIRQDAVMQQVFKYTNELMRLRTVSGSSENSQRNSRGKTLHLVTYVIVPLSPISGVLEWVDNTQSLSEYLMDKVVKKRTVAIGAHSRYFEGEWNHSLCRATSFAAKSGERRAIFDKICRNISPVFRYFFVEKFGHDLQKWHNAKMAYTRSCAVSSIVGHILGIGDRHCGNILVHQKTGEIVHIDFGIVFEQGRLLPTPETVPFRLTRDIVDGMGPLGTDGTFTAAAEVTIRILRNNSNELLTILSAVVNDPLYEWKKSAAKARVRQEEDGEESASKSRKGNKITAGAQEIEEPEDNLTAMHAIARIKEKLQGYEEGASSEQLSVDGQVQLLINAARDPDNLCRLYNGWAAWM